MTEKIQHTKLEGETRLNNRHTSEILKAVGAGGLKHLPVEVCTFISWPQRLRSDSKTYSF